MIAQKHGWISVDLSQSWSLIQVNYTSRAVHFEQERVKTEHMAAPTKAAANVKKALANSEPSTHGTYRHSLRRNNSIASGE
jgi:hypothetical protein